MLNNNSKTSRCAKFQVMHPILDDRNVNKPANCSHWLKMRSIDVFIITYTITSFYNLKYNSKSTKKFFKGVIKIKKEENI